MSEPTKSGAGGANFAPAFYPGKEAWKNEPGNRYTPEELRAMDREWDVKLKRPRRRTVRKAD